MPRSARSKQAEARRCTEAVRDLLLGYKARMEEYLRDTGVTLPQLRMLKAVNAQQEVSAATIARLCQITPQTLQAMLTRATREGWIVRGTSDRNHRFVTAALTPLGREILEQGMTLAEQIEEEIWKGVSVQSMKAMRRTLECGLTNLARDRAGADRQDRAS